jgi:uncharacterized protein (DUF362 family)
LSTVAVRKSNYQNVYQDIQPAIENGGGLSLKDGDTVVIKPNLCDFRFPESGAVTHPIFLDATLKYLNSTFKNLKIFVVESDATSARPDLLMKWLGFDSILRKNNATYVNLSKAKTFKKDLKGRYFKELDIPEILDGSTYFISMAKLKTAMVTKIISIINSMTLFSTLIWL